MKPLAGLSFAFLFIVCAAMCQEPNGATIKGQVRDGRSGEPLARVDMVLEDAPGRAITDSRGQFEIKDVKPGDYALRVSTVGYRMVLTRFSIAAGEVKDFDVALTPDNLGPTTNLEVKAGPFGSPRIESPSEISLSGNDEKNLATVLADDPLRAVQAMPGVTSDDDFTSRLSLRAADYSRIGLYLDGVLLHQPYHLLDSEGGAVTVTAIDGDMLDNIDVQAGVFPSQFADSTAAALNLETREGSQVKPSFRITASASNAGALGEGPLGKDHAGDWILSVRKSYLQYIIDHTSPTLAPYAFGLFDYQGRVTYNLRNRNKVSLAFIDGYSDLNRDRDFSSLGGNDIKKSNYHYTLANLGWNYTPNEHFLTTNHVAWSREALFDENKINLNFDRGQYGEWVWNSDAVWMWHAQDSFDFGWSMRRIRDDGLTRTFQYRPDAYLEENDYRGTALREGGYGEQIWKTAQGRVTLTAGVRWDKYGVDAVQTVLPQAMLGVAPWASTRLSLGFGQYAQGPDPNWAFSVLGGSRLLPERANSFVAAVEQRLDPRTRLRVEVYDRQDRDLLFRSFFEPRLIGGQIFTPPANPPIDNALDGHARGMQIFLQRRSANRLTGWVSYSFGNSRLQDREAAIAFPSDQDQRHSVNVYLGYRLRPTVNLSFRSIYGSGMPLPGFYRLQNGAYYLSATRNALYDRAYARSDVRLNKAWELRRRKLTLYCEALNVFDRANPRYDNLNGYNPATGQATLEFMNMLPILPSVGVTWDF